MTPPRGPGPPGMAPTHPLVRVCEPGSCKLFAGCQGSGGATEGTRGRDAATSIGGSGKAENLPSGLKAEPSGHPLPRASQMPSIAGFTCHWSSHHVQTSPLPRSAGAGWRGWGAAAPRPRPQPRARPAPHPTPPALLPAPHTRSGPGKAAAPCAKPQTVRCPQLPRASIYLKTSKIISNS